MTVLQSDRKAAADQSAGALRALCGNPPVLHLVQLELFSTGRTAVLIPGDPVLEVMDRRPLVAACEV